MSPIKGNPAAFACPTPFRGSSVRVASGADGNNLAIGSRLLLIKDVNVVVFPPARISAFYGDGECLAILGYYPRTCLDYLPGLRTAVVDGARVNLRMGACVVTLRSRRRMGLSIINVY